MGEHPFRQIHTSVFWRGDHLFYPIEDQTGLDELVSATLVVPLKNGGTKEVVVQVLKRNEICAERQCDIYVAVPDEYVVEFLNDEHKAVIESDSYDPADYE